MRLGFIANFLSPDVIVKIALGEVKKQQRKYQKRNPDFSITFSPEDAKRLVDSTYDKKFGARKPKDMIKEYIGGEAAKIILEQRSLGKAASGELIAFYNNDHFSFELRPLKPCSEILQNEEEAIV